MQRLVNMSEKRISLGINVSILVILIIFGVLLSLPLQLLMNTNYYTGNQTGDSENVTMEATGNETIAEALAIPFDHRRLKRCPRFEYEDRVKSVFRSDYDGNCTYMDGYVNDNTVEEEDEEDRDEKGGEESEDRSKVTKEAAGENLTQGTEESGKDRRMKSVPVAGHILVTMLLISAIAALVEVLRIRFARDKDSSKAGSAGSRKASTVELPVQRRFVPRQPMLSHRSFEMQGMHRSALRLLGARPPPLIRRSSFPTQPSKQSVSSLTGTPNNRMSRRQSAESEEDIGVLIGTLHHRTRLIRRH